MSDWQLDRGVNCIVRVLRCTSFSRETAGCQVCTLSPAQEDNLFCYDNHRWFAVYLDYLHVITHKKIYIFGFLKTDHVCISLK